MTASNYQQRQSTFNVSNIFRIFLILGGFLFMNPVFAHSGATGVVKERMDMMDKIGENMKSIKAMIQGKKEFNPEAMVRHAEAISSTSTHITKVFPEGSIKGKSEALPSIWKKWDKFESLTNQLTFEANKLKDIAMTQNRKAVMKQFAKIGKTCRSCHTDFRKKQDGKE